MCALVVATRLEHGELSFCRSQASAAGRCQPGMVWDRAKLCSVDDTRWGLEGDVVRKLAPHSHTVPASQTLSHRLLYGQISRDDGACGHVKAMDAMLPWVMRIANKRKRKEVHVRCEGCLWPTELARQLKNRSAMRGACGQHNNNSNNEGNTRGMRWA